MDAAAPIEGNAACAYAVQGESSGQMMRVSWAKDVNSREISRPFFAD